MNLYASYKKYEEDRNVYQSHNEFHNKLIKKLIKILKAKLSKIAETRKIHEKYEHVLVLRSEQVKEIRS